jgi:hypothetical protein
MVSENAKQVAKRVSESIRKGRKVILGKIIKEVGYSESTSESPTIVTETKSFKQEMKPIVDKMISERERAISKLKGKISKAKYRDLIDGIDKLTKNIQLLSGKETERHGFSLTEILKKADEENE